jgi:hypothetical protein
LKARDEWRKDLGPMQRMRCIAEATRTRSDGTDRGVEESGKTYLSRNSVANLDRLLSGSIGMGGAVVAKKVGLAFDDGLNANRAAPYAVKRFHGRASVIQVKVGTFVTVA